VVRIDLPADDFPISGSTEGWLEGMSPRLGWLEDFSLPPGFRFDYSRGSLAELEVIVLQRFSDADEVADDEIRNFVEGIVAYLGEAFLRVAGGWWSWDDDPDSTSLGNLVVHFDAELGIAPLSLMTLLIRSVTRRSGNEFSEVHARLEQAVEERRVKDPMWEPTKLHTPGVDPVEPPPPSEFLEAWLTERERAFPRWAAAHADAGTWDFSPESLDALEALLRHTLRSPADLATPEGRELAEQSAWYLGEVMICVKGGRWHYIPGEPHPVIPAVGRPHIRQPSPDGDVVVPIITVEGICDPQRRQSLRRRLAQYGC
jgi:hypothetical protein